MGRKRKNAVHSFFSYDKTSNESSCLVPGCSVKIKGLHPTNLIYHISSKHKAEHEIVLRRNSLAQQDQLPEDSSDNQASNSANEVSVPTKSKMKKIDYIKEQCVNLVAIHGRPFSLMSDEAFKNILALISIDARELAAINYRTIREELITMAEKKRRDISINLKNKMICIKIDGATRQDRSFFGVNVQYLENNEIIINNLGVVELYTRSTAENLKEKLLYVLRKYQVSVKQILTITTDNGANYLKVAKLINEENEDCDVEESSEDEEQEPQAIAFPTVILNSRDDDIDLETENAYSVASIRCAAHTLQLAVSDALRENEISPVLEQARAVVRHLRTPSVRQILRAANKKAILDCVTRWNSTIDMLQRLTDLRDCCSTDPTEPSYISYTTWDAVNDIIKSLLPAKVLTKILQSEQLTVGDFYYQWTKCILETEKIEVPLAQFICVAMRTRQKTLMEIPHFVSALYLDPRFQVVLSAEEISKAINYLTSIWCHLLRLNSRTSEPEALNEHNEQNPDQSNSSVDDSNIEDEMEKILAATERRKQTQQVYSRPAGPNITFLLEQFNNHPRLSPKESVIKFWETKKITDPQLYQIANVILATPCTQVSVERLFSSLKFVLSDLRYNLKGNIVEDILVLRNNK